MKTRYCTPKLPGYEDSGAEPVYVISGSEERIPEAISQADAEIKKVDA